MKSEGYLQLTAEWAVRSRQDLVRRATGWEGAGSTRLGECNTIRVGAMVVCAAIRGNGSNLGGGSTLGSGTKLGSRTTLGGGNGSWYWTGKWWTGRGGTGTGSGVGGDRIVDGIQLEKRQRSLEMAESCS